MAQDDERHYRLRTMVMRDANVLLDIPGFIEDLNEAGQEVELVISGYDWLIKHKGGSIHCHSWQDVHAILKDMVARLTAEYGEPGRPE